jgi:hypothetical protein
MTVFIANTNVLELNGLQSSIDDSYINDADVTVTIKDSSGTSVSGQTWPATMSYLSGTSGDYRLILDYDLALTAKRSYTAEITATKDGNRGFWKHVFQPVERT